MTIRQRIVNWVMDPTIQAIVLVVILLNALTLGAEATAWGRQPEVAPVLSALDKIALTIFVAEIGLKLIAFGPKFFRDPWNVFDFVVVGIALIPGTGPFAVLRALRVLRVLRVIQSFPQMRFIVEAMIRSLPGIAAVAGLLVIIFFVGAVMTTQLFGAGFPQYFGDVFSALFTLFQVMSLEGWPDVAREIMEVYPYAWTFFIPFILISSFTILNLFIGIILDTMQTVHDQDAPGGTPAPAAPATAAKVDEVLAELRALRAEMNEMRAAGPAIRDGE